MIDIFLLFCCVLSLILMTRSCDIFNFFNPTVYFFWVYLLFSSLGFFYRDLYDYAIDISDETAFLIGFGLLSYSLGVLVASNRKGKSRLKNNLNNLIETAVLEYKFKPLFVTLTCLLPLVFALIFTLQAGEILWFQDEFDTKRIELRKGSGWIAIIGISSAYFATILLGLQAYKSNRFLLPTLGLAIVSLSALSFGNRAPIIDIFVIYFTFAWMKKFNRISPFHFVSAFLSVLALMASLGILRQGLEFDGEMLLKQLLWRPFVVVQNIEWMVEFIPSMHTYFFGESAIIELMVLAPGYQPNFGTYMKELLGVDFSGGSITFGITGMLYADFGPVLAVMCMSIVGFILQRIYFRNSRSGEHFITLIITSISLKGIATSGIVSPIIYTLIPCWALYTGANYIHKRLIATE